MLESLFLIYQLEMEIKALKSFNAITIPYLYGIYFSSNNMVLHQEYIPGGTLRMYAKMNKIDAKDCFKICWKLLQIVYMIQQKQFIHRDIKPSNIMIQKIQLKKTLNMNKSNDDCSETNTNRNDQAEYDYKITLIDFGLCVTIPDEKIRKKLMEKICGTKGYIAPEIICANTEEKRDNLDQFKIDVFSLGMILYELITKKNPFYSKNSSVILKNNMRCKIDYSHENIQALDDDQKEFLYGLCEKNPKKRFSAGNAQVHPAVMDFEFELMDENRNDDQARFCDKKLYVPSALPCKNPLIDNKGNISTGNPTAMTNQVNLVHSSFHQSISSSFQSQSLSKSKINLPNNSILNGNQNVNYNTNISKNYAGMIPSIISNKVIGLPNSNCMTPDKTNISNGNQKLKPPIPSHNEAKSISITSLQSILPLNSNQSFSEYFKSQDSGSRIVVSFNSISSMNKSHHRMNNADIKSYGSLKYDDSSQSLSSVSSQKASLKNCGLNKLKAVCGKKKKNGRLINSLASYTGENKHKESNLTKFLKCESIDLGDSNLQESNDSLDKKNSEISNQSISKNFRKSRTMVVTKNVKEDESDSPGQIIKHSKKQKSEKKDGIKKGCTETYQGRKEKGGRTKSSLFYRQASLTKEAERGKSANARK